MHAMTNYDHIPVMMPQVIDALKVGQRQSGNFIDATYGRGGHSSAILDSLGDNGRLYAFDRDRSAIDAANTHHGHDHRLTAIHARFSDIVSNMRRFSSDIRVDGILADLGVSSPQLDDPARGFSFLKNGPLDLRMDQSEGMTVSDWLNTESEETLIQVLKTLGEERFARRIARRIVGQRQSTPIKTTRQLSDLVAECVPTAQPRKHPATRTFQAFRMYVNQEVRELERFLPQCIELLRQGGRLVVISFHSIEHRIVKRFFQEQSIGSPGPQGIPFRQSDFRPTLKVVGKPIYPDAPEIKQNRRSRSAVMRVAERIAVSNNA